MSHHESTSTFAISTWEEKPYREDGGMKLTLAEVTQTYSGSLVGQAEIRYVMLYPGEGITTTFTGLEYFTGALDGHEGAFGLRWNGEDDGTAARGRGTVIEGSGTGALAGLAGEATYEATRSGDIAFSLSYELG